MLGLLGGGGVVADLAARATAWLADGLVSPSAALLADGTSRSTEESLRILRSAAVELDATFPTLQAARAFYVERSLPSLTSAEGVAGIAALSNGLTDEWSARLRRLFRRG